MNMHKTNYVYVVNPGNFGGTPFFAAYEVEDLVDRPDSLPETEVSDSGLSVRPGWIQSVVRLPKAAHQLICETLWRRAVRRSELQLK